MPITTAALLRYNAPPLIHGTIRVADGPAHTERDLTEQTSPALVRRAAASYEWLPQAAGSADSLLGT